VLDIGSGSGYVTDKLSAGFSSAEIIALDIAEGMLRYARGKYSPANVHWLCGDAENLPLAENSIDLVFSNLALQWCENSRTLFAEIYRVLKPGGEAFIATLGPQTLQELRMAWEAVDTAVHVNRFEEKTVLQSAIQQAGLQIEDWQEQLSQPVLPQLRDLFLELKALGAHNVNPGRPKGLTGRARLQQLQNSYPRNDNNELIASWQLWFIQLRKPVRVIRNE
jgi:malonyl-CoA O-methyltransferase